jgi:NAD+ synthase
MRLAVSCRVQHTTASTHPATCDDDRERARRSLTKDALAIDPAREADRIAASLRVQVLDTLRRKGVVVGLSGGVNSSVVAGLAVRAFGAEKVIALLMPERDSSREALTLGKLVAERFGIEAIVENVGLTLAALGCYERQAAAIREIFPEYGDGWTYELDAPRLTVRSPEGEERTEAMTPTAYRALVAATSFKSRVRKTLEYFHADRLQYAVAGTPNRLEFDQGFFVKQGDGAADVKPIAHLYKTQVYALADWLGVPREVTSRPPTTTVDYRRMDLCLYAHEHDISAADASAALELRPEQVERIYREIEANRRATRYLHTPPLLLEDVE